VQKRTAPEDINSYKSSLQKFIAANQKSVSVVQIKRNQQNSEFFIWRRSHHIQGGMIERAYQTG